MRKDGDYMKALYLTASDISQILGISKSRSYVLIRECNNELKEKGYLTIAGKVSKKYFAEKYYGFSELVS